ncbi:cation-translocating P-type ATPase [Candidatus Beckwithbacteria bacterium]|nr:cation-translocating P-type ATPase [Candidatus Beckwithbacteria bacterium]
MQQYTGLTQVEANNRLKKNGYNEILAQKPQSVFGLIIKIIAEPMILLLLLIGSIYLFLGEPKDSLALFASIFFVIGITLYQEHKTEKAIQALKDLSSPRALVIRDNEQKRIAGREIVVDDIIILQEGDRVTADAVVLNAQNLLIDESLLTGESLPVRKEIWDSKTEIKTGSENSSFVFSGTLIAQGWGIAKVSKTGMQTEMGKIGKTLQTIEESDSLLKKEIGHIIRIYGIAGIVCCALMFFMYIVVKGDILNGILRGLTLSLSMLPEEFPMVLTIFLTLGAWRISKKNVLTRNSQAIETLGATTVLCVDKTGTLTQNRMSLTTLTTNDKTIELTGFKNKLEQETANLLLYAKLASKRGAFDPLEKEINSQYSNLVDKNENNLRNWHLLKSYNLSKELLAVSRIWQAPHQKDYLVSCKGAPEAIINMCKLSAHERKAWTEKITELANQGQRILAVAQGSLADKNFPKSQQQFELKFLGLIGFVDPLRQTVSKSMTECIRAGIRVIMITGDYPGTAIHIASKAGIVHADKCITGTELAEMSEKELRQKITDVNIFARVIPDQKLKIVEALKANEEIVAMTGDGVNDGPALKAAHIGIAMGEKGTDVARESADLVLLDDNFTSIVSAVKMGRRIYDNLQKAVTFIFSVHIPIAGVSLIPVFFDLPFILFPIHIAFLELIIDPASSIIFETEPAENDIMNRPPRRLNQPLFSNSYILRGLIQGIVVLGLVMLAFVLALKTGKIESNARFIAFATLVICNLVLVRTNLTKLSLFQKVNFINNKSFYAILAITLGIISAIAYIPFLRELFHFSAINLFELFWIGGLALICYLLLEFLKIITQNKAEVKTE